MLFRIMKIGYIFLSCLLMAIAGIRLLLPFYLYYGDQIVRSLNYDRYLELTPFWMVALIPWDIILAISGIQSLLRNEREQIFENAFKLSILSIAVIWTMNGLGDRFQIRASHMLKWRMDRYSVNSRDKNVIDTIQRRFTCCGFNNLMTWSSANRLPDSCCHQKVCTIANAYVNGCIHPLIEYMDRLNVWLLLANFPFIELVMSLWNCLLTDHLPTPNVVHETGDRQQQLTPMNVMNAVYADQPSSTRTSDDVTIRDVQPSVGGEQIIHNQDVSTLELHD